MTDSNLPRIPDAIDRRRLAAMQFVAQMRAAADRNGTGFVGGFIDPLTGERFVMTNLDVTADHRARQLIDGQDIIPPWDDPLT